MTRKKKTVIIVVALVLVIAVSATLLITVTKNKRFEEEAENTEVVMLDKDGLTNSASELQEVDTKPEGNNHTGTQTTTGKVEGDSQSVTQMTTEESNKPTTESGNTANGGKPTGGTSGSTTSQYTTAQPPVTQAPTTQTPTTTEQPSGGNQGNGNGGNAHQHTWEAQYRTVHHDEEGHYENVCVQEAYDEPVYGTHYVCNYCGLDLDLAGTNPDTHCTVCGPPLSEDDIRYVPGLITTAGSSYGTIRVQVGTTHHEAVYEKKWIVDKKAYDDQVLDGYKCTTCGATK